MQVECRSGWLKQRSKQLAHCIPDIANTIEHKGKQPVVLIMINKCLIKSHSLISVAINYNYGMAKINLMNDSEISRFNLKVLNKF